MQTRSNSKQSSFLNHFGGSRVCNSNDSIVSRKTPANSISKRFVEMSWIQIIDGYNKINRNRMRDTTFETLLIFKCLNKNVI